MGGDNEERENKDKELINKICDKASTFYNLTYALGCALAPIIGGAICDQWGFRRTSEFMAMICLFLFIFYLVVGVICYKDRNEEVR